MQLTDLLPLAISHPDAVREELKAHPELVDEIFALKKQVDAIDNVTLEGFQVAYRAFYDRPLPEVDHEITREFVKAFHERTGVMYMSWRGKGKTTFLVAWCAYLMGVRPVGSTVLVRINDGKAKETGKAIAAIVETSPGWKKLFGHVVPDKRAGWSVEGGFNVMDTRITGPVDASDFESRYAEWRALCLKDHVAEQSLICAGIESGSIIGVHPSNGMWFDDLHDEGNTRSPAEMKKVVDILEGNIIPTWFSASGSPTLGVFCTPWSADDAYQVMLKSGMFKLFKLPIFERSDDEDAVLFEPYGYKVKPTWPEKFPIELIEQLWEANPARFGQMYLLDLESLKGLRLKIEWLHQYPADKIDLTWPVYLGIDFASTADKLKQKDRDYFALAVGRLSPMGLILTGGFRGKITTPEALIKTQSIAAMYPTLVAIGVEKYGKGEEFLNMLIYATNLPILAFPYEGRVNLSKGQKFELELAPMFVSTRMWILDVEDDFLRAFKDEWRTWDGQKSLTRHDDTLDATYGLAYVAQGHLFPRLQQNQLPAGVKVRQRSPMSGIGTERGYGAE